MKSVSTLAAASCGVFPPAVRRPSTVRRSKRRTISPFGSAKTQSPTQKSLVFACTGRLRSTAPASDNAVSRSRWTLAMRAGEKLSSESRSWFSKKSDQPKLTDENSAAVLREADSCLLSGINLPTGGLLFVKPFCTLDQFSNQTPTSRRERARLVFVGRGRARSPLVKSLHCKAFSSSSMSEKGGLQTFSIKSDGGRLRCPGPHLLRRQSAARES